VKPVVSRATATMAKLNLLCYIGSLNAPLFLHAEWCCFGILKASEDATRNLLS
jgi:hypothetical protein